MRISWGMKSTMRFLVLSVILANAASLFAQGLTILGVQSTNQGNGAAVQPGATVDASGGTGAGQGAPYAPSAALASNPQGGGPLVYYVLCPTGDDESYFESLARGNPATIMNLCRSDAQGAQAASGVRGDVNFIRVKLASVEDYTRVLREGLMPAQPRQGTPVYRVSELSASNCRVLGFAMISHAGCDGPFPIYQSGGQQAPYAIFQQDRQSADGSSLYNRLVVGARFRFAGCNTANDYMWYEHDVPGYRANPSVAHAAAAIYADKRVVAYGHYNTGDVKNTEYIYFACDGGRSYPTRHLLAKDAYRFYTTNAASQYEPALIHYTSAQVRDAYMQYYAQYGYPLTPKDERRTQSGVEGDLVMRAPRPVSIARETAKPAVLQAVVNAVAQYPSAGAQAVTYAFRQYPGADGDAYRGMMPRLTALAQYGKLQQAIRDTYAARGRVDMDDMRLWAMMFAPDSKYTSYRADLCDDPNVARTPFLR